MSEKPYEVRAWIFLFASSAILVIYSLLFLYFLLTSPSSTGKTWEEITVFSPGLASLLNLTIVLSGAAMLGLGIFGIMIARISYRRAERWAWFALWYLVIFTVVGIVVDFSTSGSVAFTFIIISLLAMSGQLLTYGKFLYKHS